MKKVSIAYEFGAHHVLTYDNFSARDNDYTEGHGEESFNCLALYGTLVQFGNSSGKVGHIKIADLHSSFRNVRGFSLGTTRALKPRMLQHVAQDIFSLLKGENFQVPIAKFFALEDMQKAHEFMESRQQQRKILIKI